MKKFLTLTIAFLMLFALAGCGQYTPPISSGGNGSTVTPPGSGDDPALPPEADDGAFTVTLLFGGEKYIPKESVNVIWTDVEGVGVYYAPFNEEGVASRTGLDGNYKVTLQNIPEGFTYDPNIYEADNDHRHTEITIFALTHDFGMSTTPDKYSPIILPGTGTFRIYLQSSSQTVFFRARPNRTGEYSVQSIADVTQNKINPILDVYFGTYAYMPETPNEICDGGGQAQNTYTKNFLWMTTIADRQQEFIFALRSTCIDETAYPFPIDFIVEWEGEITGGDEPEFRVVEPSEQFVQQPNSYLPFRYVASLNVTRTLDGSLFKRNPDDGYYHFYDEASDTYGGVLYAIINRDTEVVTTESGTGFCDGLVRLRLRENVNDPDPCDYQNFIDQYKDYTDNNGAYPVTEELKAFLLKYSIANSIFNDGNGWAETTAGYQSSHANQWLFNCGYYER